MAVDGSHVAALHHKLRDKPYQANETAEMLAKRFRLAEAWGLAPRRRTPCRTVHRYREHRREGGSIDRPSRQPFDMSGDTVLNGRLTLRECTEKPARAAHLPRGHPATGK